MTRPPSRRWSGEWGVRSTPVRAEVDVLIPTVGRVAELGVTLAGLAAQESPSFRVVIAEQGQSDSVTAHPSIEAMARVLGAEARAVHVLHRAERRGLAEQRQFLLDHATARYVLFLDDDVWLEPGALARMHAAIEELGCGVVGQAVQGLSHLDDERPWELESFEPWDGTVIPERIRPGTREFGRWRLHNAANLAHLAAQLHMEPGRWRAYHVAWTGGCTMYDRAALIASGGFDFWRELPEAHAGEDVAAQWRVMERYGGAGIVPSGAVHLEAPTTVPDRRVNATEVVFSDAASR